MPVEITVTEGVCQGGYHDKGQRIVVDWVTPEGMCLGAWMAISPYVLTLLCDGRFPWEEEADAITIHCPDPAGITLELRRCP